ncbi:Hypothetical protein AJAP_31725 [Amycolatopsis japonica]|uniref:Uncharacterized protein n=1 Tax=Amycolatopsis japonica TaxID=208439 RepID=A0A075V3S6_9PSEU|nr:DUF5994 family protein [Amycolatopsis japonica]AIG79164.1 Hypothetical protein AJAP_31725 [Amycolatopsis japonica]
MKSVPHTTHAMRFAQAADELRHHAPRLRLKPEAPTTGWVDGAWWPRSLDLTVELPSLLPALTARLGRIERVTYHLAAWPPTPRRLRSGDEHGDVRLEGFRSPHTATLTVIGLGARRRLTLLVIPPDADPDLAHHALLTATRRGNADTVDTLLAALDEDTAVQRWEVEGGRIPARPEPVDA